MKFNNLTLTLWTFSCALLTSPAFSPMYPSQNDTNLRRHALQWQTHPPLIFLKNIFIELMNTATSYVEFNFNNTMYKQTDGIAMGSLLGPVLVNIFVWYHESLLFDSTTKPCMHQRYVDNTFAISKTENDREIFYNKLNILHPSLKFTLEKETDGTLPFLDVKIEKDTNKFLTSVYRKPTFIGQYTHWDSFGQPHWHTCSQSLKNLLQK